MKNILYLHAGAEMYGADKVMLDLVKRIDKSEYTPYVVLPEEGILAEAFRKENIYVEVMPYPIMRRKYFNLFGIIQFFCGLIKYSKKLKKFAKDKNINVVHTNTAAVLEGCYVSKKLRIPHLWSIHEIIVSPKIMYKVTSKLIAKYSSITITDSNAVKNHIENSGYFNSGKIKTIYNGVDSNRFNPETDCNYLYEEWNIPKDATIIGMMGRVNSWKGQMDFLQAANIVMEKNNSVYTVFIGSAFKGEEWREKELETAIAESNYANRIVNKGYRTDSEAIYKLFDVFVLPSTNPDPLPTVVLEAMSTGKPIVGYRHGGVCEMVKENHNGLFAEVCNPESLAEKIIEIIEDESKLKEFSKNSRERLLNNFSIEAYVKNYSDEYDRLFQSYKGKN